MLERLGRWFGRGPGWQRTGSDPDYRFSLANERTFLAWVRTSLALMAAAVAVVQLLPNHQLNGARRALGILLAIVALIVSATAYAHWAANERAMRTGAPLPRLPLLITVSTALTVIAIVVVGVVVFA